MIKVPLYSQDKFKMPKHDQNPHIYVSGPGPIRIFGSDLNQLAHRHSIWISLYNKSHYHAITRRTHVPRCYEYPSTIIYSNFSPIYSLYLSSISIYIFPLPQSISQIFILQVILCRWNLQIYFDPNYNPTPPNRSK